MLPAQNRLKNERDFAALAKSRKSAYAKLVGLKMRENHLPHSRFGIVVGLKVHKRAVVRNLVKRRIREVIRPLLPQIKGGYDVMIMALPIATKAEFPEIKDQVTLCLQKAGLLPKS
jgi:ribonuclease P protein component